MLLSAQKSAWITARKRAGTGRRFLFHSDGADEAPYKGILLEASVTLRELCKKWNRSLDLFYLVIIFPRK